MEERLQKILSACGIASRRAAEGYITAGRVTVNGQVAGLGDKADPERDEILVDGRPVRREEQRTYVLLHKPRGYVTTLSDEKGRKTVAQLVEGCGARVWPVGRLDLDSEGLLLLTDDGDLTHRLIHPSHEVEKEYRVWVQGDAEGALPVLTGPMTLDGAPLRRAKVKIIGRHREETVLSFLIHEGKNRQIRRMCAMAGLEVRRLRRIREGPIRLGDLPPGTWRNLTEEEVSALKCLHF